MIRALWLLLLTCLSFAQAAHAHTRSQSFSNWEVRGQDAYFVFAVDVRRVTQLGTLYPETPNLLALLQTHVAETLTASQQGKACRLDSLPAAGQAREVLRLRGRFICALDIADNPINVSVNSFFAVSPTHIHIARVQGAEDMEPGDYVLQQGVSDFTLPPRAPPGSLAGFIRAGFHHVLSGLDHIVFLIALALVARTPRQAVLCITGFTLGHTAALGLSVFGLMSPHEMLVEAVIGFTIALLALEAGTLRGLSRPKAFTGFAALAGLICLIPLGAGPYWILAICLGLFTFASGRMSEKMSLGLLPILTLAFGLVHGAGFAGGLQEMSLSQAHIIKPLIGFNIGVELAQLVILSSVYLAVLAVGRMHFGLKVTSEIVVSLLIFALGVFWFAQRLWI